MNTFPQTPGPLATKSEWIAFHLAVIAIKRASGGL
jgi:hypothetical protein